MKSYEHQKSSNSHSRTGNKISASHKDPTEEMLPIVDKPANQFIISEEAVQFGSEAVEKQLNRKVGGIL